MLGPNMAATDTSANEMVQSRFQKFNLFDYVGRCQIAHITLSLLNEFLHLGLDDASDTLPKVRTAHGEGRDCVGKKGRYSLR